MGQQDSYNIVTHHHKQEVSGMDYVKTDVKIDIVSVLVWIIILIESIA